jgi:hypothetical protein
MAWKGGSRSDKQNLKYATPENNATMEIKL